MSRIPKLSEPDLQEFLGIPNLAVDSQLLAANEQEGLPGGEGNHVLAWKAGQIRALKDPDGEREARRTALSAVAMYRGRSDEQVIRGISAERVTCDSTALHIPFEEAFGPRGEDPSPSRELLLWTLTFSFSDPPLNWPNRLVTDDEAERYEALPDTREELSGDQLEWVLQLSRSIERRWGVVDAVLALRMESTRNLASAIQRGLISAEKDELRMAWRRGRLGG